MSLGFELETQPLADYLTLTRDRILAGARQGMVEAVGKLSEDVASKLHGNPIQSRTGDLEDAVLHGTRVLPSNPAPETQAVIGIVTTSTGKFRNKGLWFEFGTRFPQKGKGLGNYPTQLLRHRAANDRSGYRIAPKPFFNVTVQEDYPTLIDLIQARIADAGEAGNV